MRFFVAIITLLIGCVTTLDAQTFLDRLQQKQPGLGTVTVTESKEIDDLVNGISRATSPTVTVVKKKPEANESKRETTTTRRETHVIKTTPVRKEESKERNENTTRTERAEDNSDLDIPVVDMRKKIMRNSYKVTGYRVQAFAGGNSRKDKMKAENIGERIKMRYPDQPIYVHFYSPRWICRVGNYRTYQEAAAMLKKIKAMGYKSAVIVKGKITVQY